MKQEKTDDVSMDKVVRRPHVLIRGIRILARNPSAFFITIYRWSYRYVTDAIGDLKYGIATGLWKRREGNPSKQFNAYEPVPYVTLRDIKSHLQQHHITAPLFLDIGCGYGRPLYYFANDFSELKGYEIVPEICIPASKMLRAAQEKNRIYEKISLVLEDATLNLPIDQDMVIFFYNSFGPDPMKRFSERLKLSCKNIHIYYVEPTHVSLLESLLGVPSEAFSNFVKVRYLHVPAKKNTESDTDS